MSQPAPLYDLPGRYQTGRRWLLLLMLLVVSQVIAHAVASTWAALEMARLHGGWFREIGQPLTVLVGYPVMAPHAWWGLGRTAPDYVLDLDEPGRVEPTITDVIDQSVEPAEPIEPPVAVAPPPKPGSKRASYDFDDQL